MATIDDFYLRLPRWAQNLALDLKGVLEAKQRFSGEYAALRREAAVLRHTSRDEVERHSFRRLAQVLTVAHQHTGFYRQFWGSARVPSASSWEELRELPILEKSTARERNDALRSRAVDAPLVLQTTGTTGTPLRIFATPAARRRNYAYFDDFLQYRGIDPRARRVVIGGRVVVPQTESEVPWRFSRSLNTMYLSAYHISPAAIPAIVRAIGEYEPVYLEAYPSAASELSRLAVSAGLGFSRPISVVTSAETLLPTQEEQIHELFRGQVFDQYGSAEMCVFAERCDRGSYHVREDYSLVEVLGEDGRPTIPGDVGRIICTGLVNDGMPLIRYAIGDFAEVASNPCACGWNTPVWTRILGRLDDLIRTPSGRRIGRLSPILKGFPIAEAQYIQERIDEIRVLVVAVEGYLPETAQRIVLAVAKRVGPEMRVTVEQVSAIPRGPGGKFRAVISKISGS